MSQLDKGANRPLTALRPDIVVIGAQRGTVDLLVLQLTDARKVRSDDDLVFWGATRSREGAVELTAGDRATIDLTAVPQDVSVLAVAVAMDDAAPGSLASVAGLAVTVGDTEPVSAAASGLSDERAAVLVELYRRDGGWKVRNVSAGWSGGLSALVTEHGVTLDDSAAAAPPPAAVPAAPPMPVAPPMPPPPAPGTAVNFPPPSAQLPPPTGPAIDAPPPVSFPPPSQPAPVTPAPGGGQQRVDLGKRNGAINLTKGQRVEIDSSELIVASITWPPATDYDVFALIRYRDGRTEAVSAFGTSDDPKFSLASADGSVRHLGDVGRSGPAGGRKKSSWFGGGKAAASGEPAPMAVERIEIRPHAQIAAIVPVAYSAQSNGTGSFRRYQVSMSLDNGRGTTVQVDATNADANDQIYSCVPGIILITDSGVVIDSLELYSAPGSERRPTIGPDLSVQMDTGATNLYK
ncbi:TerD family protein [Nakamurella sp. A5-74]|uniref:TerD family protein n=1 Tax=Nakamurella sp. A5-74 TaxID=3158264 RepID=A0AAU8DNC6_9ACTN